MEMFRQVIDLLLHLDKYLACGVSCLRGHASTSDN
jgi:hypothetical protein